MSHSASGADATPSGDELDRHTNSSIDSNKDYPIPSIDYEKGKRFIS